MPKVIWALFDDANSSYYNALNEHFVVYSIGINKRSFPNYQQIDISMTNPNLIKQLSKLPKPDIILASPPCQSWSTADAAGRMVIGVWDIRNKLYYDKYNLTAHKLKVRHFEQKEASRILGESTAGAMVKIIKHFKPNNWVIENPTSSLLWEFIKQHWDWDGIKNKTFYNNYNMSFSLKPTCFLSNVKLGLKSNHKIRTMDVWERSGNRSDIPKELILDIISSLNKH